MKKKVSEDELIIEGTIEDKGKVISLDIGKFYKFEQEDFEIDITTVRYSNNCYIQVMGQDVFVDFLELPGVKKDGKLIANATRIYMTHTQAKKLVETLGGVLENSYKAGRLETYPPSKK